MNGKEHVAALSARLYRRPHSRTVPVVPVRAPACPAFLPGPARPRHDFGDASPPLGMGGLPTTGQHTDSIAFEPGDILLLHTDGVIEARSPKGGFPRFPPL